MFEKLLALMPSNPGMSQQLAFYARRMREEAAIRRTGLVFIVLAFMVQFFAVLSPAQLTSAASPNDLVNGGIAPTAHDPRSAKQQAYDACTNTHLDYGTILANYGIDCSVFKSDDTVKVSLDPNSHNGQLWSMGRLSYDLNREHPVTINGVKYYVRPLADWGPNPYDALKVKAIDGTVYWILFGCGNLVSIGSPQPYTPPKNPGLKITKQLTNLAEGSTVRPGDALSYQLTITNPGSSLTHNIDVTDVMPDHTTYKSMSQNAGASNVAYKTASQTALWSFPQLAASNSDGKTMSFTVTVKANTPDGTQICNIAHAVASDVGQKDSNKVCVKVKIDSPPPGTCDNGGLDPNGPVCHPTCQNGGIDKDSPECNPTCENGGIPKDNPACNPTCENGGLDKDSKECTPTCENGGLDKNSSQCSCLHDASSDNPGACIDTHKTGVYGTTSSGSNADGTTAPAGSVITYTLYAKNIGKATFKDYPFQEDLSDVLVYADVTDLHGGKIDSKGQVTWPKITIPAGQTKSVMVTVKVKSPVPVTPADPADPKRYDLTMVNIYGNAITIKVPSPPVKTISTVTGSLPNTGPGTSLFIGAVVVVFAGYFYSRSRLLQEESTIAVQEAANA